MIGRCRYNIRGNRQIMFQNVRLKSILYENLFFPLYFLVIYIFFFIEKPLENVMRPFVHSQISKI